jgi:hypothetical protein
VEEKMLWKSRERDERFVTTFNSKAVVRAYENRCPDEQPYYAQYLTSVILEPTPPRRGFRSESPFTYFPPESCER